MHIVTSTWRTKVYQCQIEWCSFMGTNIIHNPFTRWWGCPFSSSEILNAQLRCDNRPHQTRPNTMVNVWRKNQKWGSILRTFLGQFGRVLKIPDWKWQNILFTQLRSPSCGASVLVHPRSGPGQRGSGYQQKKSTDIFLYKDGIVVCIFAMNNTKGEYQAVDYWLAGWWDGHGHEDANDGGARSSRGGLPHSTTSKATRRLLTCWWLFQPVKKTLRCLTSRSSLAAAESLEVRVNHRSARSFLSPCFPGYYADPSEPSRCQVEPWICIQF